MKKTGAKEELMRLLPLLIVLRTGCRPNEAIKIYRQKLMEKNTVPSASVTTSACYKASLVAE